jgi:hypothetical protein
MGSYGPAAYWLALRTVRSLLGPTLASLGALLGEFAHHPD